METFLLDAFFADAGSAFRFAFRAVLGMAIYRFFHGKTQPENSRFLDYNHGPRANAQIAIMPVRLNAAAPKQVKPAMNSSPSLNRRAFLRHMTALAGATTTLGLGALNAEAGRNPAGIPLRVLGRTKQ